MKLIISMIFVYFLLNCQNEIKEKKERKKALYCIILVAELNKSSRNVEATGIGGMGCIVNYYNQSQ